MKGDLILNRCNAYSATGYLYADITTKDRPVLATNIEAGAIGEIPADRKGGIIVFPQGVDDIQLITDKLDRVCWTAGRFLKGLHVNSNGKVYSKDSLSVEITGVSDDVLIKLCRELCRALGQETAMVKLYSERNKIIFPNTSPERF